jgi:hypothetical protein
MDPYLERPGLWEEVHAGLIVEIQQFLNPLIRPRYRVAIERRTFLTISTPDTFVGKPDVLITSSPEQMLGAAPVAAVASVRPRVVELPMPVEVIERYLEIRDVETNNVVTVIEILSPSNKSSHTGRRQYERKRFSVLGSMTHLIEIDLLRAGKPFPFHTSAGDTHSDYRIVVSRAQQRPHADAYLFSVRNPVPDVPIPLQPGEAEPGLPLNQVLHELYDRAGYDLAVNYQQPPQPPLSEQDARWMAQLLREFKNPGFF